DLSELLTSSPRVAIVSAIWLDVSTIVWVSVCERASIMSTIDAAFCAKPSATRSRRDDIICCMLVAISSNSSLSWSDFKLRLEVSGFGGVGGRVAGRFERWGGLATGALEPVEQVAAALAERVDHRVAGVAERHRDVLALLGERAGDALRRLVDPVGDRLAHRG